MYFYFLLIYSEIKNTHILQGDCAGYILCGEQKRTSARFGNTIVIPRLRSNVFKRFSLIHENKEIPEQVIRER